MNALVVDDSMAMRAVLRNLLEPAGFRVHEAPDAETALRLLADPPAPDLVLMDWNLPGMNGLEGVRRIRAQRSLDAVRVLMVTTEVAPPEIAAALQAGAQEYLMKPFTPEAFRERLDLLGFPRP